MTKKVITNERTKNALHNQFKSFLDGEKISEQIEKKIEEHSIKKGIVKEVYPYLDTSLIQLSDDKLVEAYHLHRVFGNIIDLFTPEGEQIYSETKNEPCIIPRSQLKCLVAEISDEYVLLGYYSPNMVKSFSPAEEGHYLIKTLTDGFNAGLDIHANNINIMAHEGASFTETSSGESTEVEYANSKNTYTKDQVYNKTQIDKLLDDIWNYIDPERNND
jgi:hypothetical protein